MNKLNPFDPNQPLFTGCACGKHRSQEEHIQDAEKMSQDFIEASLVKALFPDELRRRAFIKAVGVGGAMSALSGFLPVDSLLAMAQEKGTLEKKDL